MLVSGVLAAVVAVMLTVQTPLVTPDFALRDTIVVLAGVVLGGLNRPIPATLGGFAIGFASGILGGALPTNQSQYLPRSSSRRSSSCCSSARTGSSRAAQPLERV